MTKPKLKKQSKAVTISVDQAAVRLGIGRNQAYEGVRRGDIPAIRVGTRWLVPMAALKRLLACGEPTASR